MPMKSLKMSQNKVQLVGNISTKVNLQSQHIH